ncbi:MAG: hypothetical protein M3O36_11810 [Myxococcota bacterium]|nr:hypothetical protein [Myxococcota bacterium]
MDLAINPVIQPGFTLDPSYESGRLVVRLAGNADMNVIVALSTELKRIHDEAVRLKVREVVCDFARLYFMNSSCFKSFVAWIATVETMEQSQRYRIRLRSNQELHWQKRSFEALRSLSDTVVSIES